MKEKQLRHLSAYSCFGFAVFCLLWISLSYFLLPIKEGQNDYSLLVNDNEWIYVSIIGLISSILGISAVIGVFYANRDVGGVLLFIGVITLLWGLALEFASLTWDIFIWPVLCANDKFLSFVREGIFIKSFQFKIFTIVLLFSLGIGNIFTAIGLLKIKRFGRITPLLLIAGILLYGVGSLLIMHVATVGLCIYSLSFVLIGLRLLKE